MTSKELPKIYDPKKVEDEIYKNWEESGYFNPDNLEGEPYSIMMPPPNVTGVLHLGHAMENTIMDIMARYQRMQGKKVLLLPGTDHAAVATQAKVEKVLIEKGIENPREELGREGLLKEIRQYAENSKSTIISQIKKMGTSCDWSRLAYTFDETRGKAVNEVFKKMYEDGLIYRGYKTINWSVRGQSTCSDDELEYKERTGKFYTFKYSGDFPISIATTRPETKLGDTAVAVNPKDKRYKEYIGKNFKIKNFAESGIDLDIKIISDESVDKNFGTGAVGVTPAHSMVDFDMYEKQKSLNNQIKLIQVIGQDGKMNNNAGKYEGFSAEEAREKIVENLKKNNLIEKEEEISQNVSTSDRFGDITEVLPMTQWFVDVNKNIPGKEKSLKDLMREAVTIGHNGNKNQKIDITPKRFEKTYFQWIDNLRDWCISRQVWWGHRIPIWHCQNPECGNIFYSDEDILKCKKCGSKVEQDPDTLDTWFSSGLWTFSTLGWPEKTKDLETFHPTSWMQMGYEILFFWMARMILMSTYTLDEIPFKDVYIHGMLRDEDGNKFSKSAGNNIDPMEVSDKYGTDALRLSLISGISPGNDSKFYEEKVESARNFSNKLWNISRYILKEAESSILNYEISEDDIKELNAKDKWIIGELNITIEKVTGNMNKYNFSMAEEILHHFIWNEFADWYIEFSKIEKNGKVLLYVLDNTLRLLHPFAPFITEEIWKNLSKDKNLIISNWPKTLILDSSSTSPYTIDKIKQIIVSIRDLKSAYNIASSKNVKVQILIENRSVIDNLRLRDFDRHIKKLARIENLELIENKDEISKNSAAKVISGVGNVFLNLEGIINIDKEKASTEKEIKNLENYIKGIEKKLSNKEFTEKAPEAVVTQEKEKLEKANTQLKELQNYLKQL